MRILITGGSGFIGTHLRKALQKHEVINYDLKEGKDILFHGATALIIVGSKPDASCPKEDALLATQNILLAAHCMGLGTCLIGFAVAAMSKDPAIKQYAGIPGEESIHSVIALGYPDETYERIVGRKTPVIRQTNL